MKFAYTPRTLSAVLRRAMTTFPAVVVTGPRQSGKTTLLRMETASSHRFVSLEEPDVRMLAREDPRAFLDANPPPVVLDEIQYAPQLLSYIKGRIDAERRPGNWLLTGSQQFSLMQGVTESLAGRAAVLELLPLSLAELSGHGEQGMTPEMFFSPETSHEPAADCPNTSDWLLRGGYPELALHQEVDRELWCASYITTYLERDVRSLVNVGDLSTFERFIRLCAARTGTILNQSEMARDLGISVPTVRRWLSALETGRQVLLLPPYFANIGKRLMKSPKLYFLDTALASSLMGIHSGEVLLNGPSLGPLFETAVVSDFYKRFLHHGKRPSLYYLRTRDGLKADLVADLGGRLHLLEVKSAKTIFPGHWQGINRWRSQLAAKAGQAVLLSRSESLIKPQDGVWRLPWQALAV